MSNKTNEQLWEAKEVEISDWLKEHGLEMTDLHKDKKGFFVLLPSKFCTDQNGNCEPNERCDCKEPVYLPDELQTI